MDVESYYTREIAKGETVELVAVMQRPGKRSWAIYAASLLTDPAQRQRDPDIYLAERMAAGDTRVVALPSEPIWRSINGKWRPVAGYRNAAGILTRKPILPAWTMGGNGKWVWRQV